MHRYRGLVGWDGTAGANEKGTCIDFYLVPSIIYSDLLTHNIYFHSTIQQST